MSSENKFKKARNAYCRNALKSGLGRLKGCFFYDASQRKKNKEIEDMENQIDEWDYSQDEIDRRTSEFLDKIDILEMIKSDKEIYGKDTLSSLREHLEMAYEDTDEIKNSDFFQGYLFNWWDESEFENYLYKRYGDKLIMTQEVITHLTVN